MAGAAPRLVLLTLESTMSAEAALSFARAFRSRLVLVGLSDPFRRAAGGAFGQLRRHLARSGPRILPYLAVGFTLPQLAGTLRRILARSGGGLEAFCRESDVPMVQVEDVNGADFRAALAASRADLIVSLHFDQILAADTVALAPMGGINLHPSLLPHHRGPMPAFWALSDDPPVGFGVTVHRLAPRIDAGAILAQRRVELPQGLSATEAARRLHLAGVPLLAAAVDALATGQAEEREAPLLPYRPFPDAAALRAAALRGVRLVRARDAMAALRVPRPA